MSRILKVNGDYILQVTSGNSITLDTQSSAGQVTVHGNLDVKGALTYIESTNTQISDNILQLNYGQTGTGVGNGSGPQTAGIEVERGSLSPSQFLFSELVTHYDATTGLNPTGTWKLTTSAGILGGLQVRTIANDGLADLVFDLQGGTPVLRVANSTNYYLRVIDANDIPTVQWVQNYVSSSWSPLSPGTQGSAVVPYIQYPVTVSVGAAQSSVQATSTNIIFQVAQNTIATISSTGFQSGNISVGGTSTPDTLTNTAGSTHNLILTSVNGVVEVNAVTELDNQNSTPSYTNGATKLYSYGTSGGVSYGPGKTGIYFTNSASRTPDELISRNRAVLLSILL
jgi:hypothetical protein